MGFPMLVRCRLYIEAAPRLFGFASKHFLHTFDIPRLTWCDRAYSATITVIKLCSDLHSRTTHHSSTGCLFSWFILYKERKMTAIYRERYSWVLWWLVCTVTVVTRRGLRRAFLAMWASNQDILENYNIIADLRTPINRCFVPIRDLKIPGAWVGFVSVSSWRQRKTE